VVDPGVGVDDVRNVGIKGHTVRAVTQSPLEGAVVIDAYGLVVCPGFIDLHSHAQNLAGRRLQACDGVTTALELEAGRSPVRAAYEREALVGSPIHYGFSASWAVARRQALAGRPADGSMKGGLSVLGEPDWTGPATAEQRSRVLGQLAGDLANGALGVGVLLGYAPDVEPGEYIDIAKLAAAAGAPTFTHSRDLAEVSPRALADGAEELVRAASESGAHMHYCHINSTSSRFIERVLAVIDRCRAAGGRVSVEAYPYGSSSTAINAPFLAPERLGERGLKPESVTYLRTGERVASAARLEELRKSDANGLAVVEFLDEDDPSGRASLLRALTYADTIIASDALPLVAINSAFDAGSWPLMPGALTHPRSAGCFARSLRLWRQEGRPLADIIRRCTWLPAQVLEARCPAMKAKGRLAPGCDADVVVFDAARVTDRATYTNGATPSLGIVHVLVDGQFVVRDGQLVPDANPGRPVIAA